MSKRPCCLRPVLAAASHNSDPASVKSCPLSAALGPLCKPGLRCRANTAKPERVGASPGPLRSWSVLLFIAVLVHILARANQHRMRASSHCLWVSMHQGPSPAGKPVHPITTTGMVMPWALWKMFCITGFHCQHGFFAQAAAQSTNTSVWGCRAQRVTGSSSPLPQRISLLSIC